MVGPKLARDVMSQQPTVSPISLGDLSSADYSFGECELPNHKYDHVLVVKFVGEAGNSYEHCGTFSFMEAIVAAGVAAWDPAGIHFSIGWQRFLKGVGSFGRLWRIIRKCWKRLRE